MDGGSRESTKKDVMSAERTVKAGETRVRLPVQNRSWFQRQGEALGCQKEQSVIRSEDDVGRPVKVTRIEVVLNV